MAEDNRDVLMKITPKSGVVPAECTAMIAKDDALADGFISATATASANFFALQNFQMDMGLLADPSPNTDPKAEKETRKKDAQTQQQLAALWKAQKMLTDSMPLGGGGSANRFMRFMSKGPIALKTKSYSCDLESVSITKQMDASSLTLFTACKDKTVLPSAVVIKRRGGGGKQLRTFLRIEFTSLLITDFNWSEDDVINEQIKFICRSASVKYSIEKDDGTLKSPGQPGTWAMKP
jgi:type VI protein secretion system component Hcp